MRRYRFLMFALLTVFLGTGDVSAVILPNPDPTAPHFTEGWWLQMLILAAFSVVFGFVIVLFGRWLQRQDEADAKQDKRIDDLGAKLNERTEELSLKVSTCQVHCASHRGNLVSRDDFEARMIRFEESIGKLYGICDQTNIKVGKIEGLFSRELGLQRDSAGKSE